VWCILHNYFAIALVCTAGRFPDSEAISDPFAQSFLQSAQRSPLHAQRFLYSAGGFLDSALHFSGFAEAEAAIALRVGCRGIQMMFSQRRQRQREYKFTHYGTEEIQFILQRRRDAKYLLRINENMINLAFYRSDMYALHLLPADN